MKWSFYQIWNESLVSDGERKLEPRNHIWASEMGGAMIDRFLKMKAVPPTNPPNPRSRRKFEAGNIWEAIVGYVLSRAGILIDKQTWLAYQYPNLLKVTGKLDYTAGGNPDYDKAAAIIESDFNWLPKFVTRATLAIAKGLKEKCPNGLEEIVLEIKSCSSFMFERYETTDNASLNHQLQTFHYLKAGDMPEGHITYISKDDARILEIPVLNPSPLEALYKNDIEQMTGYISSDTRPPREMFIVFDEFGKFSANWKIAYSQYLTHLYGLKDQFEFDKTYKPLVERWNRVLGRIKEGKQMTDNNKEALKQMEKCGFDTEKIKGQIESEVKNGTNS